ncbi:rfaE bifunctional protein kinase chain/domain [Desulfobaculum xiamenense]|uniref:RfaE bifunctional protein kinase chain/domain n=1 Tax=Desulfobaculum xiamenense TaxID=995050 RepID=A0A846QLC6_9BACT|nr:D-glycero-beta-D-manno-heptose-7-phosphate kinase [Desulfobaculum xiamenense]NJB67987.1 rfaE bifunctional protein kinase chain/domain [Desulfobaculum xiamenense]
MKRTTTLSAASLVHALDSMAGKKVLIIGDLVLDHYVMGTVGRISPEAPVPVVEVGNERHILGGAGNVARNVKTLGGSPVIIGICGRDREGERMARLLRKDGITAHVVCDDKRPTTKKTRIIAQNQQVVRVDWENSDPVTDAVLAQVMDFVRAEAVDAGVIILSDYGKGLITEEFMPHLETELAALEKRPLVLVDPKVRNFHLYTGVDLLTPNTKEAGEGAGMPISATRDDIIRAGQEIFRRLGNRNLLVTLGAEGMALFEGPDRVRHIPTAARKVFDVTGAGDTVIATLGLALSAGLDLLTSCALANYAAGMVVAEVGTAAAQADALRAALENYQDTPVEVWADETATA